jgi:hypothetical protein
MAKTRPQARRTVRDTPSARSEHLTVRDMPTAKATRRAKKASAGIAGASRERRRTDEIVEIVAADLSKDTRRDKD